MPASTKVYTASGASNRNLSIHNVGFVEYSSSPNISEPPPSISTIIPLSPASNAAIPLASCANAPSDPSPASRAARSSFSAVLATSDGRSTNRRTALRSQPSSPSAHKLRSVAMHPAN